MLKLGDPTRYEKMISIDTSLLMKEAKEIEDNAYGDYCVVRVKEGSKLIKRTLCNFDCIKIKTGV